MKTNVHPDKLKAIKLWLKTGSINIFGMPFSGKDTQCQIIARLLDAVTFSGGDILRNGDVSKQLLSEMNNGNLAPSNEYLSLVTPYFMRPEFANKPMVLSSVGRWLGEEKVVFEAANNSNHPIKGAFCLRLSHEEVLRRHNTTIRGRADDEQSKLVTRFSEFATKTEPVLDVYRSKGLLMEIDGHQKIQQVTDSILEALYNMAQL